MATKTGKVPTFTDVAEKASKSRSIANLRKGGGRPKGVPNKVNGALKDMILGALEGAGGQDYLQRQANDNPTAFMGLIGKVLPTELKNADAGGFVIKVVTGVPDPDA